MAYFPNGSTGEVLDEQCADCPLGCGWNDPEQQILFEVEYAPKPCPVAFVQMSYNYDQIDKGQEKLRECLSRLVADNGECQVRKLLLECRSEGALTSIP